MSDSLDAIIGQEVHTHLARLLSVDETVTDWTLRLRRAADGTPWQVAYIVGGRADLAAALRAQWTPKTGSVAPLAIVPVARLPLTADGLFDVAALDGVPVLDDQVVAAATALVPG